MGRRKDDVPRQQPKQTRSLKKRPLSAVIEELEADDSDLRSQTLITNANAASKKTSSTTSTNKHAPGGKTVDRKHRDTDPHSGPVSGAGGRSVCARPERSATCVDRKTTATTKKKSSSGSGPTPSSKLHGLRSVPSIRVNGEAVTSSDCVNDVDSSSVDSGLCSVDSGLSSSISSGSCGDSCDSQGVVGDSSRSNSNNISNSPIFPGKTSHHSQGRRSALAGAASLFPPIETPSTSLSQQRGRRGARAGLTSDDIDVTDFHGDDDDNDDDDDDDDDTLLPSDMTRVRQTADRLHLSTRRPSVMQWRAQYVERPAFLVPSRRTSGRDDVKTEDDVAEEVADEGEERKEGGGEGRWSVERAQKINSALDWIRNELMEMRSQDQLLARQLLTIRNDMHQLKLARSCEEHQDMLDDVQSELEELQEFADVLDLPVPTITDSPLKHLGVTRMNFSARRFSTC